MDGLRLATSRSWKGPVRAAGWNSLFTLTRRRLLVCSSTMLMHTQGSLSRVPHRSVLDFIFKCGWIRHVCLGGASNPDFETVFSARWLIPR